MIKSPDAVFFYKSAFWMMWTHIFWRETTSGLTQRNHVVVKVDIADHFPFATQAGRHADDLTFPSFGKRVSARWSWAGQVQTAEKRLRQMLLIWDQETQRQVCPVTWGWERWPDLFQSNKEARRVRLVQQFSWLWKFAPGITPLWHSNPNSSCYPEAVFGFEWRTERLFILFF